MDDRSVSVKEYWFARRFPLGDHRNAMAPVHWKGWLVSSIFVLVLMIAGVAFAYLGATDQLMFGIAEFILVAFIATSWFLLTSRANGDPVRTVAEYKKDKIGA